MTHEQLQQAGVLIITNNGDGLLQLHVQPGAKRTEIVGLHGDRLKLRLKAQPLDGKANKELMKWAADYFALPKANILLIRGRSSRQKTLKIKGLEL